MIRFAILAALSLALAACATPNTRNYEAYAQAQATAAQQQSMMVQTIASAEACNGDARCVEQRAALAAVLAAGMGGGRQQIAAPQREPTTAEQAVALVGALTPLTGVLVNGYTGYRQAGYSRDIALRQQDTLAGIANAPWSSLGGILSAVTPDHPTTAITVGGDYVSGTQHVGDAIGGDVVTAGRDLIGGSQQLGDNVGGDQIGGDNRVGDDIGRDLIGGDRIDGSNIGDGNRIGSPGPFDTDNSGQCTGERCQGDGDVLPPDEGEGG